MTLQTAEQELCRKLSINYSDLIAGNLDLFTQADIDAWINLGVLQAWDYKPWPFSQGAKTATTIADTDYYDYPQDFVEGTGYLLRVAALEYKKLLFEDYQHFFQSDQNPTATDKFWTEYKNFIFINKNAYNGGVDSFDLFGKLKAPTLVNPTDLLPFSPSTDTEQYSGNTAVVKLAFAEALMSDKKKDPERAEAERNDAFQTLDLLWKPFADSKSTLQSNNRPFFDTPDYFGSRFTAGNQFTPGNF